MNFIAFRHTSHISTIRLSFTHVLPQPRRLTPPRPASPAYILPITDTSQPCRPISFSSQATDSFSFLFFHFLCYYSFPSWCSCSVLAPHYHGGKVLTVFPFRACACFFFLTTKAFCSVSTSCLLPGSLLSLPPLAAPPAPLHCFAAGCLVSLSLHNITSNFLFQLLSFSSFLPLPGSFPPSLHSSSSSPPPLPAHAPAPSRSPGAAPSYDDPQYISQLPLENSRTSSPPFSVYL